MIKRHLIVFSVLLCLAVFGITIAENQSAHAQNPVYEVNVVLVEYRDAAMIFEGKDYALRSASRDGYGWVAIHVEITSPESAVFQLLLPTEDVTLADMDGNTFNLFSVGIVLPEAGEFAIVLPDEDGIIFGDSAFSLSGIADRVYSVPDDYFSLAMVDKREGGGVFVAVEPDIPTWELRGIEPAATGQFQ